MTSYKQVKYYLYLAFTALSTLSPSSLSFSQSIYQSITKIFTLYLRFLPPSKIVFNSMLWMYVSFVFPIVPRIMCQKWNCIFDSHQSAVIIKVWIQLLTMNSFFKGQKCFEILIIRRLEQTEKETLKKDKWEFPLWLSGSKPN